MGNICIVTSSIPPILAGGGLRAYRYAKRLHEKNKLAFILTHMPNLNIQKEFRFNREDELPAEKIVRLSAARTREKNYKQNLIKYFFPFIIGHIHLLMSISWAMYHRRNSFEVIRCFGTGGLVSSYAVLIGKLLGKRTIIEMTLLGSDDPLSIGKDTGKLGRVLSRLVFSKADAVISISPALSSAYRLSGLPTEKLREISNPVDTVRFCPPSLMEKFELRKRLNINNGQFVILFVGFITKRKGIDLLIDSFKKLTDRCPEVLLLLAGPCSRGKKITDFAKRMKQKVEALNIAERVVFAGFVDNVDEYMKASDIFVLLSEKEGCPNVALEAMSTGLPVVTLNIPGITKHIIQDRIDGIIVKERDPGKIASAMKSLLENLASYKRISENARKTVLKRFSTEVVHQQYQQLYEDITRLNHTLFAKTNKKR